MQITFDTTKWSISHIVGCSLKMMFIYQFDLILVTMFHITQSTWRGRKKNELFYVYLLLKSLFLLILHNNFDYLDLSKTPNGNYIFRTINIKYQHR